MVERGVEHATATALSGLMQNMNSDDPQIKSDCLNDFVALIKNQPHVFKLLHPQPLIIKIRWLCIDRDKVVRAQALRLLRYLLKGCPFFNLMLDHSFDFFISKALERDKNCIWERVQALKLIRRIMELCPMLMPRTLVMSLIAVAENPEDSFAGVSLETLCELALVNVEIFASCNGVKILVDSILNPSFSEISQSLTLTLIHILDHYSTRRFLRPSLDISRLFSIFTDIYTPISQERESMKLTAHKALITLLRSWTGILCLTSDKHGLRSLVDYMALPQGVANGSWVKDAIFDLFFHLLDVLKSNSGVIVDFKYDTQPNLIYNYIVMVLLSLIDCGIVNVLVSLSLSDDMDFRDIARRLLNEILLLSADLLPNSLCESLNSMASVLRSAVDFGASVAPQRLRATAVMNNLSLFLQQSKIPELKSISEGVNMMALTDNDAISRESNEHDSCIHSINTESLVSCYSFRTKSHFMHSNLKKRLNAAIKADIRRPISEVDIQQLFKQSNVLKDKNWRIWDWSVCLYLMQGPLLFNHHHLSTALNNKFCKRILSFLNPKKRFFCDMDWTSSNLIIVQVATQLFRCLLSFEDGSEFVFFKECVSNLVDALHLHLPSFRIHQKTRESTQSFLRMSFATDEPISDVLSLFNTQTKLSREYITLFGVLSSYKNGLKFFFQHELFGKLKELALDPSKDYLTRLFISALDFSTDDFNTKDVLQYWLQHGSYYVRKFAVNNFRLLFRSNIPLFVEWILPLLVFQLKCEPEIAMTSLSILEESCTSDKKILKELAKLEPPLDKYRPYSDRLITLFAGVHDGVKYLQSIGILDDQLKYWEESKNIEYVVSLENSLVSTLNDSSTQHPYNISKSRSETDDLLFDCLHQLPWNLDLSLEHSNGLQISVQTDSYLETMSSSCWLAHFAPRFLRNENLPYESVDDDSMFLHVIALVVDQSGRPTPIHIDEDIVISAKLFIGSQKGDLHSKKLFTCSSSDRMGLSSDHYVLCTDAAVSWHFIVRDINSPRVNSKSPLRLAYVSIKIPLNFASAAASVPLEPHFFGELAKTDLGSSIIQENGSVTHLVENILSEKYAIDSIELRAALWVIGHIGSSSTGIFILEEFDILPFIVDQASNCQLLSLRGTCFYILGLISRSTVGREFLSEFGWDVTNHPKIGIAIPKDYSSFLHVSTIPFEGCWAFDQANEYGVRTNVIPDSIPSVISPPICSPEEVFLANINKLCNHVTQKQAYSDLVKMKKKRPDLFSSALLLREVFKMISCYHYRISVRRFLFFDLLGDTLFSPETIRVFDVRIAFTPVVSFDGSNELYVKPKSSKKECPSIPLAKISSPRGIRSSNIHTAKIVSSPRSTTSRVSKLSSPRSSKLSPSPKKDKISPRTVDSIKPAIPSKPIRTSANISTKPLANQSARSSSVRELASKWPPASASN